MRWPPLLCFLAFLPAVLLGGESVPAVEDKVPAAPALAAGKTNVVVIPVREQVDTPLLFIVRRGLKEAIEQKAEVVVLDMKTPGGALGVTFEIMEALAKFPGKTITFINDEAISAGAFISATTEEIWFAPSGVIGAAAPVTATGQDVDATMRQKIVSYLKARVRATSEGKGYRGQVISAMIDSNYELKIGEKVLKGKDELLTLTASEAAQTYGDPPQPLLAAGIAKDIDELLTKKFGEGAYAVKKLEVTWSERLAVFLRAISPLLLGAGLLALYIEFKTPGFGVFGAAGFSLLAIVFLSNYVAGLSGHEPILVFGLGLLLVFAELFFFPGIIFVALTGLVLMLVSLVWSMADIWPNEPITFDSDLLFVPLRDLSFGLLFAIALIGIFARLIPKGWLWDRLVLQTSVRAQAQQSGTFVETPTSSTDLVGQRGIAATALFPTGQVEIGGKRFEAKLAVGSAPAGTPVVVTEQSEFALTVEVVS